MVRIGHRMVAPTASPDPPAGRAARQPIARSSMRPATCSSKRASPACGSSTSRPGRAWARATIYRRWPSKEALALELVLGLAAPHLDIADVGDTRAELRAAAGNPLAAIAGTPWGPVIRAMLSQIAGNPAIGDPFRAAVVARRRAEVTRVIERGIARGDLRPDADPTIATELLVGPVYFRLVFGGRARRRASPGSDRRRRLPPRSPPADHPAGPPPAPEPRSLGSDRADRPRPWGRSGPHRPRLGRRTLVDMQIVTPSRGRRRDPERRPGLPPLRGGHAVGPPRRPRRSRPGAPRRRRRPPPHRGSRAAPGAGDGRPLPASGAVHRPERPGGGERGPGRLRPGLPVRRPAALRDAAAAARRRASSTRRPPDAHGFCSLGTSVEAMHAGDPAPRRRSSSSSTARCRGRSARASSTSTRSTSRSRSTSPPYELASARIGDVERRIGEYVAELVPDGATLQLGIGAIPAADGARPARQARPRHPHRDVHRRGRRPRRGGRRSPAPARSATGARS